jgi:hypothetical protein
MLGVPWLGALGGVQGERPVLSSVGSRLLLSALLSPLYWEKGGR